MIFIFTLLLSNYANCLPYAEWPDRHFESITHLPISSVINMSRGYHITYLYSKLRSNYSIPTLFSVSNVTPNQHLSLNKCNFSVIPKFKLHHHLIPHVLTSGCCLTPLMLDRNFIWWLSRGVKITSPCHFSFNGLFWCKWIYIVSDTSKKSIYFLIF